MFTARSESEHTSTVPVGSRQTAKQTKIQYKSITSFGDEKGVSKLPGVEIKIPLINKL